ncbi:MAG: hypothetical protein OEZ59_13610, partial [Deltaproteobacteria bacterium]|nr:hypothetical protein [Deltaproteobacteria bacterium]
MSSCFKITLALLALLLTAATDAGAIRLSAVYYSACRRDVGVILHADQSRVKLLRLDGEIRSFYRFEIVYLAHYPVGSLSIEQVKNPEEVELVSVQTLHQREIADLALGWMMDHSEDEFSFLGLDGVETVVRADDIWDINFIRRAEALRFPSSGEKFRYVHPYPFQHCEYDDSGTGSGEAGSGEAGMVYPQQLVADPLLIKRELDHLQTGHERLRSFVSSKPFYPVPQIYRNDTELGMWLTAGSRHGASLTRSNSLTPVLVSGLSEGPFGFQRIWVAGAAPMGYSVHEEPQTQLYYRLKADHVHFSVMYDISAPLIGESKYNWHDYELGEVDDRWNELFHLAGGFDYGRMAMDISGNNLQYAVKHQGR